jgi:hypothetical protein
MYGIIMTEEDQAKINKGGNEKGNRKDPARGICEIEKKLT